MIRRQLKVKQKIQNFIIPRERSVSPEKEDRKLLTI